MKNKLFGVLLALITITAFLGMGAVSVGAEVVGGEPTVMEYTWKDQVTLSTIGSDNSTDFKAGWASAMEKSNQGYLVEIKLLADWTLADGNLTQEGAIKIVKNANVILNLGGHTVKRYPDLAQVNGEVVISVDNGASVVIKNGVISGKFNSNALGLVYANGAENIEISGVEFVTEGKNGVATTFENCSNVTLNDCEFNGMLSGECAGAVRFDECENTTVKYCSFKNITTEQDGVVFAREVRKFKIEKTVFENCAVESGALYVDECVEVLVENCDFSAVKATENGGAIWLDGSKYVAVNNCIFNECGSLNGAGGVIFASDLQFFTVSNCEFENCNGDNGGVANVEYSAGIIFENCTFKNNKATENGGAFYIYDSDVAFENCEFISNDANGNGGAIFVCTAQKNTTVSANNCTFTQNTAKNGGAVCVSGGEKLGSFVNVNSCAFTLNEATVNGGAIHIENASDFDSVILKDSSVAENKAGSIGGGVLVDGVNASEVLGLTGNVIINGNLAKDGASDNLYIENGSQISVYAENLISNDSSIGLSGSFTEPTACVLLNDNVNRLAFFSDSANWALKKVYSGIWTINFETLENANLFNIHAGENVTVLNGANVGDTVEVSAPLTIEINGMPYRFTHWEANDVEFENAKGNQTTFVMPNSEVLINAVYKEDIFEINLENAMIIAGKGIVGEVIIVMTDNREEGVFFGGWVSEDISIAESDRRNNTITFIMPEHNVNLKAVYGKKPVDPVFSHKSGTYSSAFNLELLVAEGIEIRYGFGANSECVNVYSTPIDISKAPITVEIKEGYIYKVYYVNVITVSEEGVYSDVTHLRFQIGEGKKLATTEDIKEHDSFRTMLSNGLFSAVLSILALAAGGAALGILIIDKKKACTASVEEVNAEEENKTED